MKSLNKIYVLAVLLLCLGQQAILGQTELEMVNFKINVPEGISFQTPVLGKRILKASGCKPGSIQVHTAPNWLDGLPVEKKDIIEASIKSAVNIWKLYINGTKLNLSINLSSTMTQDIETEVLFIPNVNDSTSYPLSFHKNHIETDNAVYAAYYDATITINSQVDWGMGYETLSSNLTLGLLQAISHALGFGSSIKLNTDRTFVIIPTTYYTPFDKLIFSSSGQYLSSIPIRIGGRRPNPSLEAFANPQSDNIYVLSQIPQYQLFAPFEYADYASFKYFNNNNSLMSYIPHNGQEAIVDTLTLRLLNEVGWQFETPQQLKIVSTDIDSTGHASAYSSHHFVLSGAPEGLSNHNWELRLPLADGELQTIATSNTEDFTIPSITNEAHYTISDNREIVGEISYTGYQGQQEYTASYMIRLQLKPHILAVEVLSKGWSDSTEDYYNVTVGVRYEGCFYLYSSLEEEYGIWANSQTSFEPYFSRINFNTVDAWGNAYITLTARNDYGTDTQTIEIPCPKDFGLSRLISCSKGIADKQANHCTIDVYTLSGEFVAQAKDDGDLTSVCKKGNTYILKQRNGKRIKYLQK